MSGNVTHIKNLSGLREEEVPALQKQFGKNSFYVHQPRRLPHIVRDVVSEPMFILLAIACTLYFILGEATEGLMMLAAMTFVAGISLYQDVRSSRAIEALKEFTEPKVTVIRNNATKTINSEDLVPGDLILLEEGNKVPADAEVLQENDLSVNESILTGESLPVEKHETSGHNQLYQGTTINSGRCYAIVQKTGANTTLGKIGRSVKRYSPPKTLLQNQVNRFVKRLAFFGISAFVVIFAINYAQTGTLVQSLLFGLTLAMAAVPEEIPVAFSSFMALGAYRMSRLGIITRQPQTIENLGSVSVLCLDKTGTITENRMALRNVYDFRSDKKIETGNGAGEFLKHSKVIAYAMLASEQQPFDAMELAIHQAYEQFVYDDDWKKLTQVYEYPLEGRPPMMTHVYEKDGSNLVAAKGAVERILDVCRLDATTKNYLTSLVNDEAANGYRIIGVASAAHDNGPLPGSQNDFKWSFEGFVSLYDPPKKNADAVLKQLSEAGITIKLLTGDHPNTAIHIASQVGIPGSVNYLTGDDVMNSKDAELEEAVVSTHLFARMFPEAKLRVIDTLKKQRHIVAMTGDGVNDAPALQSADIGIAMGSRGTEMARQTADLVLTDDNLQKVVEAIRQGRTIFNNIRKAVRYIISIHIPVILTVVLPLVLGWKFPNLFTPIHIIFLELIMGPTCSIFFEREPVVENIMTLTPRDRNMGLFTTSEMVISITQGLAITLGALWIYQFAVKQQYSLEETRSMVFTTLLIANLLLTFTNRSFTENITRTIRYRNPLAAWIVGLSASFVVVIHFVPPVRELFGMSSITARDFLWCTVVAIASVCWFEIFKTFGISKVKRVNLTQT